MQVSSIKIQENITSPFAYLSSALLIKAGHTKMIIKSKARPHALIPISQKEYLHPSTTHHPKPKFNSLKSI